MQFMAAVYRGSIPWWLSSWICGPTCHSSMATAFAIASPRPLVVQLGWQLLNYTWHLSLGLFISERSDAVIVVDFGDLAVREFWGIFREFLGLFREFLG